MGFEVGLEVGLSDLPLVVGFVAGGEGLAVGLEVGLAEGSLVGAAEGLKLGLAEGLLLGVADGD